MQKVGIAHPRLAILISTLKEEENFFKVQSLKSYSKDMTISEKNQNLDEKLSFTKFLEKIKLKRTQKYNLRLIENDYAFMAVKSEIKIIDKNRNVWNQQRKEKNLYLEKY